MAYAFDSTDLETAVRWMLCGVTLLLTGSCFAADKDDSAGADISYMPDEVPAGEECETDGCAPQPPDVPPGAAGSPCDGSEGCNAGLICAAPFQRGERGTYACVSACVSLMNEDRWCADASSCCHADAVCTPRGYCIVPDSGESTGSEAESSGSDTDATTTG